MKTRRLLQALMLILAALILGLFGIPGIIRGAGRVVGEDVTPFLDSEFRFLSALACCVAFVLLWAVRRPERHVTAVRLAAGAALLGGISRLISWASVGRPPDFLVVATGVELVGPLLVLVLLARVARAGGPPTPG